MLNLFAAGFPSIGKDNLGKILAEMELVPAVRAEQLTVEQFADLACRLSDTVTR